MHDIRTKINLKKLKKQPGISWIEHNGEIHEFNVDDNSHFIFNEINKNRIIGKFICVSYEIS